MSTDPSAELSPDCTPFRFAFKKLISFTDSTGMYEDGYGGGGDWHTDNDVQEQNTWNFHIGFNGSDDTGQDWINSISFGRDISIKYGGGDANASGYQDDFMADMGSEYSSEANESGSQVEQNCCPDPNGRIGNKLTSFPLIKNNC